MNFNVKEVKYFIFIEHLLSTCYMPQELLSTSFQAEYDIALAPQFTG